MYPAKMTLSDNPRRGNFRFEPCAIGPVSNDQIFEVRKPLEQKRHDVDHFIETFITLLRRQTPHGQNDFDLIANRTASPTSYRVAAVGNGRDRRNLAG